MCAFMWDFCAWLDETSVRANTVTRWARITQSFFKPEHITQKLMLGDSTQETTVTGNAEIGGTTVGGTYISIFLTN